MIELLLVVGIILILISLVLFGVFRAGEGARGRNTEATLQNLTTMLAAYRQSDIAAGRERGVREPVTVFGALPAPGLVSVDQDPMEPAFRDALVLTQQVMSQLLRVEANQAALAELSTDAFMQVPADASGLNVVNGRLDPPILLDGWGNPVIYVPPGGLSGLHFRNEDDPRVDPLRAPDGRGYFASAGPDGIFGAQDGQPGADDNIYSFPR